MKKKVIICACLGIIVIVAIVLLIVANKKEDNKNIPKDFKIKGGVLYSYNGDESTITIPKNVKKIKDKAFADQDCDVTKLRTVIVPETVKKFGKEVFAFTCVDRVIFLEGFNAKIEYNTFMDSYLNEIYFPSSLTHVDNGIFGNVEESPGDVVLNIHINKDSYMDKYFKNENNFPDYEYIILTDYDSAVKQYINN